mmetsp:Transcript_7090/g.20173  ORF Transcript_7090/g.20173 Transcript_7090/m.20173 type:complete len:243 (+) Transcript_7090:2051-2779(+)
MSNMEMPATIGYSTLSMRTMYFSPDAYNVISANNAVSDRATGTNSVPSGYWKTDFTKLKGDPPTSAFTRRSLAGRSGVKWSNNAPNEPTAWQGLVAAMGTSLRHWPKGNSVALANSEVASSGMMSKPLIMREDLLSPPGFMWRNWNRFIAGVSAGFWTCTKNRITSSAGTVSSSKAHHIMFAPHSGVVRRMAPCKNVYRGHSLLPLSLNKKVTGATISMESPMSSLSGKEMVKSMRCLTNAL